MASRSIRMAGWSFLVVGALGAGADAAVIGDAVTIYADNGSFTDTFTIANGLLGPGAAVGELTYTLPGAITLPNTGTVIQNLTIRYVPENAVPAQENRIGLTYTLWTGASATTFTVSSGLFVLPGVPAQFGRGQATANITNGHQNIPADAGAAFAGLQPGGGGFLAQFDGAFGPAPLYVPAGSIFDVYGPNALVTTTSTNGSDFSSIAPTGVPRTSMSSQWRFNLTGGDQVGVTSSFFSSSVIPAPGAVALLALGGFATTRRRR